MGFIPCVRVRSVVLFLAVNSGAVPGVAIRGLSGWGALWSCGEQPLFFDGKLVHIGFHRVFFKLG